MKLILKEYLASLKERNQLDKILPDLLSKMGMAVFSIPKTGAGQDGVDIGAVSTGENEAVYLFSVKGGNLNRTEWDRPVNGLRAELNEIKDVYIETRIPAEHQDKPIVICICLGGEVEQNVDRHLRGYIRTSQTDRISFEEWNGDKLAELIHTYMFDERLLVEENQSYLRKSLALIDEPEASYNHFFSLLQNLIPEEGDKPEVKLQRLRELSICLWVHYGWSLRADNFEAVYRISELCLLQAWDICKFAHNKDTKVTREAVSALSSVQEAYLAATFDYAEKIRAITNIEHAVSANVLSESDVDVNLKVFDVLGRLALAGLWFFRIGVQALLDGGEERDSERLLAHEKVVESYAQGVIDLVVNNPMLFSPYKDEQVIDISLAIMLLCVIRTKEKTDFINHWIRELTARSRLTYRTHGKYVTTIRAYEALLDHPIPDDDAYQKRHTAASVLFPLLGVFAAIFDFDEAYDDLKSFQSESLSHCQFQYWYLSEESETYLYNNAEMHGSELCDITLQGGKEALLSRVFDECDATFSPDDLSVSKTGYWPLIFVACRHYRLPIPMHFFRNLRGD